MKRKFTSVGLLFMVLVVALAFLAAAYGLWSKTLTINGTVTTGEVNAAFSLHEVDEGLAREAPGGPSDNGVDEDKEVEGKDIAECKVSLLDGLDNPGPQTLSVTITTGYPSFNCYADFDVHNNGSIPIKVRSPELLDVPDWLTVEFGPCYEDGVQLEKLDEALCTLHVHVDQSAPQGAQGTFSATILAHQWNEEPPQ